MRSAIIENGIVVNVIVGEAPGSVSCGDGVGIGWAYDGADFIAPASEPEPEPEPNPKLDGIEFEGVMCSATAEDQNGLSSVLMAIGLQGEAFPPTRFYFSNGNSLVITLENYQALAATWLPFRQSFFQP